MGQNADRKIVVAWMIAVALITTRELRQKTDRPLGLPLPSAYTGSAIVYGAAAIVAEFAPDLAVVAAAGWTLAIAYRSLGANPSGKSQPATTGGSKP